jgi:hypothetical protein
LALLSCKPKQKPVCLYNKAVQLSFLGDLEESLKLYKKTAKWDLPASFMQVV